MILKNYMQDVLDALSQKSSVTLPVFKPNGLKLGYSVNEEITETLYPGSKPILPFADSDLIHTEIVGCRRLTAIEGDCKTIYEVSFDVTSANLTFKAGDSIGVIPHNDESDVNFLVNYLKLELKADVPFFLTVESESKSSKIPSHIPVKSTLRHVLTHCVDVRSISKKLFLLALSRHTKDENERKVLEFLCSKEGSETYQTHVLNKCLSILDIFLIFKSCKPPVEVLLAHLPRLLPRPYSIVNTSMNNAGIIKICFSVMTLKNSRKGLTTGWLEDLIKEQISLEYIIKKLTITNKCNKIKVPMYIRKNMSGFCLPDNLETPLLMFGPGTGVAPFLGFLEERKIAKDGNPDLKLGNAWLFFGCRDPNLDFIYQQDVEHYLKEGLLNKFSSAFSRVEKSRIKYIQDAVMENGEQVIKYINEGATIFICGDLNTMATSLRASLVACLVKFSNMTSAEADKHISGMQKEKKYIVDAWS